MCLSNTAQHNGKYCCVNLVFSGVCVCVCVILEHAIFDHLQWITGNKAEVQQSVALHMQIGSSSKV